MAKKTLKELESEARLAEEASRAAKKLLDEAKKKEADKKAAAQKEKIKKDQKAKIDRQAQVDKILVDFDDLAQKPKVVVTKQPSAIKIKTPTVEVKKVTQPEKKTLIDGLLGK